MKNSLRWSKEQASDYFRRRGLNDPSELAPREQKNRAAAPKGDPNSGELARQVHLAGMAEPALEHVFAAPRKWRFDLAWPDLMLACEVDGAVHRIKSRFKGDMEKHQAAFLLGWAVLRVSPSQVRSGAALGLVEAALTAYSTLRRQR